MRASASRSGATGTDGGPRPIAPPGESDHRRWADELVALGSEGKLPPRVQSLAADALRHLRAILHENAALREQVAALDGQVHELLAERVGLAARVHALEAQLARLRAERAGEQEALERVVAELERAAPHPARAERRPVLLRPATSVNRSPHSRLLPALADTPPAEPSPPARFQHPATSDEETLLSNAVAAAALLDAEPSEPPQRVYPAADTAASSHAIIAHPFARFSDLGQFQSAVQALPGVHNVRVRRFAQGTLEMRVDYDGAAPLAETLRALPLPITEVEQESASRLRVRLATADTP